MIDMVGKKFGRLKVLKKSQLRGNNNRIKWICICDCGKKHTITGDALRNGGTKSCGCLVGETNHKRKLKLNRKEALLRNLYSHIKTRYKKKYGTKDIISFDLFSRLSFSNCFYCGSKPGHIIRDYMHEKNKNNVIEKVSDVILYYNGIDRIDSKIGYINGNVVACCKKCNIAKLDMPIGDFKEHIIKIYNHWAINSYQY